MQPFVYVKISTKLKHIRNHFFIKQYNFSKYGIHQHYISMIESEKRSPSREMISSIYDAIFKITNGEIINLYTKEQFSMTLEEQAINWLNTNFESINKLISNYQYCINELEKYNLHSQIYGIYDKLATHYSKISDHKKAHQFYLNCIETAIRSNISPFQTYIKIGEIMKYQSEYKQAVIYFLLALKYTSENDSETYYTLQIMIAEMYYKSGDLNNCIPYIDNILNSCKNPQPLAGAKILEGLIFYEFKEHQKSIHCFQSVISELNYEPYFGYAYFGIGLHLMSQKEYQESISVLKKARHYATDTAEEIAHLLLISINYYHLQDYKIAIKYCHEARDFNSDKVEYSMVKDWYKHTLNLFFKLNEEDKIIYLLDHANKFQPKELLQELKLQYLEYLTVHYKKTPNIFHQKVEELLRY